MNLTEAELFFRRCDGSSHHMAREDHVVYEQYLSLGVPREVEVAWFCDHFNEILTSVQEGDIARDEIALQHSRLVAMTWNWPDLDCMKGLERVTGELLSQVPVEMLVIVFESLLGRSISRKDGAIFQAWKLDAPDLARRFVTHASGYAAASISRRGDGPLRTPRHRAALQAELSALSDSLGL